LKTSDFMFLCILKNVHSLSIQNYIYEACINCNDCKSIYLIIVNTILFNGKFNNLQPVQWSRVHVIFFRGKLCFNIWYCKLTPDKSGANSVQAGRVQSQ